MDLNDNDAEQILLDKMDPSEFQNRMKDSTVYKATVAAIEHLVSYGVEPTTAKELTSSIVIEKFAHMAWDERTESAVKLVSYLLAQSWFVYSPLLGHEGFINMCKRSGVN